jgi:uroporphyrinogen-III synthase
VQLIDRRDDEEEVMAEKDKPEVVKVSKTTAKKLRATGSETTEAQKRAALGQVADALRAKNEKGE